MLCFVYVSAFVCVFNAKTTCLYCQYLKFYWFKWEDVEVDLMITPPDNCPTESHIKIAFQKQLSQRSDSGLSSSYIVIKIIHWPVVLMVKMDMLTVVEEYHPMSLGSTVGDSCSNNNHYPGWKRVVNFCFNHLSVNLL